MSSPTLTILVSDRFSYRVATHLDRLCGLDAVKRIVSAERLTTQTLLDSQLNVVVVVAGSAEMEGWNRAARKAALPFLPVMMTSHVLRVGPLAIPGRGGCWACWNTRRRQHGLTNDPDAAELESGIVVGQDALALLTATRVCAVANGFSRGIVPAGSLWETDKLTLRTLSERTIGVHGCEICGLLRPEPSRTVDFIREALYPLFSGNQH